MDNVFSKERFLTSLNACKSYKSLDATLLAERLSELAEIGRTKQGGISRLVYTAEEKQAKQRLTKWLEELGLVVREDAIGNLLALYEGENPELPVVMTGSHLDTVPNGGAFDGALGVLSSLTAIEGLIKEGKRPKRSIELVVFVDEEGTRFKNGIFGSRVMMGEVTYDDLLRFEDEEGIKLVDAIKEQGLFPEKIKETHYPKENIHAFVELHIEQGKILEENQEKIGIVKGIAGPSWHSFTFVGETDHAGNTPMTHRKDSVAAAAELILAVEQIPPKVSKTAVATVGKMNVHPNGSNVIAGETTITVDARDIDEDLREQMNRQIINAANKIAEKRGLSLEHKTEITIPPVLAPQAIQDAIKHASEALKLPYRYVISGAGHDAMILGKYVPSGMIFVPSVNGKSHSPEEFTHLDDCLDGIAVLKETLYELANQ
ncbi:Zn-dependent hydrolase [Halalkalibacterium ligniniphilum]|uniref:Zn-dependent hydrolase n=1 Tax=Halalkalibacterium ligniniphilum TaxID=1134413 RepID=UPI0003462633|nr:Zn-dependent hydrolase [Halalkalibacterium ligniniphilum]